MKRRTKLLLAALGTALLVAAALTYFWVHRFRTYTPIEVTLDIRAAIAAKNSPRRVEKFLELRYGPLTEAANRQRAFLDFFNVGHIEGLRLIVQHTPPEMKQENIDMMAQWVADYRRTMTPEEKKTLGAFFNSDLGRQTLQQATACYLGQDVRYRAGTAPVIFQLMTTVAAVQKP